MPEEYFNGESQWWDYRILLSFKGSGRFQARGALFPEAGSS
jgi:hypothetical protein